QHVLRAAARVEAARADDRDGDRRALDVLRRVDRLGEAVAQLLRLDDDEAPRLTVPGAAGEAAGIEDPQQDGLRDRPVGVAAHLTPAGDGEERLHAWMLDAAARDRGRDPAAA